MAPIHTMYCLRHGSLVQPDTYSKTCQYRHNHANFGTNNCDMRAVTIKER